MAVPRKLLEKPLEELTQEKTQQFLPAEKTSGLKRYRFDRMHEQLPKVKRVLGYLKERMFGYFECRNRVQRVSTVVYDTSLWVSVNSLNLLEYRVKFLNCAAGAALKSASMPMTAKDM